MAAPMTRVLSSSQLAMLAEHGEARTADVGDTLFQIGDASYPFVAIISGEVAVLDGAGQEVIRHGSSGFLGEINLLSGQTVFLTAVVTQPMRYIAVDREELRRLMFEDGSLSDLLLSAFVERREMLQRRAGIGFEIVGPRDSPDTPGWRTSPGACGCRTRGSYQRRTRRRRHCSPGSTLTRSRSCGYPAAASCDGRATASSRARSASGGSSSSARRSTCSSSAAVPPASALPYTELQRASTRS
jgi:hypothetical protein